MSLANEVEYGQALLLVVQSQAATELLQEDRQALGRAEEQHRVELGDVDALIVQVDDEQDVHLTAAQAVLGRVAIGPRGLCREGFGGDSGLSELDRHVFSVGDADAEAQCPRLSGVEEDRADLRRSPGRHAGHFR